MNTQLLIENEKRILQLQEEYNPELGIHCQGNRVDCGGARLPVTLLEEFPHYSDMTTIEQQRARIRHDFEYWCWRCVKIIDKMTGRLVPFVLNRPQRKLLAAMEEQRLSGQPVRIILLKARQWGGSTLVQMYIAWMQIASGKGRNSVIVGHKRNSSFAIKQMFKTMLANYPPEMLDGDEELKLKNVPDSKDIQELTSRDSVICLTSSYSPDSARGLNLSLAHLSEVAFWNANRNIDPNDLIRTVTGTIPMAPETVIVMESTANGTNSFFYTEWQRAVEGRSAFKPVFVAWHEIDIYQMPIDDDFDLDQCDEYERALWEQGCTLEQICWYHEKRKEYSEHNLMKAEFPSNAREAFENSVEHVFSTMEQEQIMDAIESPREQNASGWDIWQGVENKKQALSRNPRGDGWQMPSPARRGLNSRYLAMLTIGSETDENLPTVMSIWDMNRDSTGKPGRPTLVAQWVGNKPLNLLAVDAMKVAGSYDNALLVIENNDIESRQSNRQQGTFVKNELFMKYRNLYFNNRQGNVLEVDKKNFSLMFYELILSAKNNLHCDRDKTAATAIAHMTLLPNGRYYAEHSEHQQYLVNRAEALFIVREIALKSTAPYTQQDIYRLQGYRL